MKITWTSFLTAVWPFIKAILIMAVGHYVILILLKLPRRSLLRTKLDKSLVNILLKTLNISAHIVVLLSALSAIGISTTGILAALSAAGVALALALKDSLSNIAGGILLLISPRFVTGDYIGVDSNEGFVVSIDLMHTTIRTYDNRHITFSNGSLMNSIVTNYTWDGKRRVDISFPVSYEADIEAAKQTALEVIRKTPLAIPEPEGAFLARVGSYEDSAVMLTLLLWCKCENYWTVYFDVMEKVREAFVDKGIEIPYNQLDVHVDASALSAGEKQNMQCSSEINNN